MRNQSSGVVDYLKVTKRNTSGKDRETFFRMLIDHMPQGMVVLDARGMVQFKNRIAGELISKAFSNEIKIPLKIDWFNGQCFLSIFENDRVQLFPCRTSEIAWEGETHTLIVFEDLPSTLTEKPLDVREEIIDEREVRFEKFFEYALNGFVLARVVKDASGEPVDFEFTQVNRAFEKALHLQREAIQGKSPRLFLPNIETMAVWEGFKDAARSGNAVQVKTYSDIFNKHFKLSIYAPIDGYVAVIFNDITQQVVAETELRENENKYRSLFEAMALGVVIQNRTGEITSANPAAEHILGLDQEHLIGLGSLNYDWQTVKLNGEVLPGEKHPAMVALRSGNNVDDFLLGLHNQKKNVRKWLSVSAVPEFREGETEAYQVITTFVDITDRIRVQRAFEERVKELRCLTAISSLLQKDPSLKQVCQHTVMALLSALKNPEFAFGEIRLAGEQYSTNQEGHESLNELIVPIKSSEGRIGQIRLAYIKQLPFVLPEEKDLLESVADSLALWCERTVIQKHLEESEARFRQAVMNMPAPIMIYAEDGEIITLNDSWVTLSGYSFADISTLSDWLSFAYGENDMRAEALVEKQFALEAPLDEGEFVIKTRTGEERVWGFRSAPLGRLTDGRKAVISMAIDVTQRKRVAREREHYYERIRALREVDKLIGSSLEMENVLGRVTGELSRVMQYDSMSVMLSDNGTLEIIAGQGFENPDEIIGMRFPNKPDYPNYDVIKSMLPVTSTQISTDYPNFTQPLKEDLSGRIKAWLGVPLISQDGVIGMFAIDRVVEQPFTDEDIEIAMEFANRAAIAIHNAQLYASTQEQLKRLSVLRNIDSVITNSLSLDEALPVILRQIKAGLGVDAASILLYDDEREGLVFEMGLGFLQEADHDFVIRPGRGYSGKVARDLEPVYVPELDYRQSGQKFPIDLQNEGIVSFYGLPMVAKGKLKGVLELFQRTRLTPDENWKCFSETLARQAAIAVDDILLFAALERANQDLRRSYDATIQGWAKALELRDQETEGHSQRVGALTQDLAARFGFEEDALQDVRRGVLLHDIGKMAIPDEILRKPGPLTEGEWEIMRQHPVYAYNMLKDIDYLEHALCIPRFHHERWDGSGYPEALSGEDIPLEARIFAVVDVWDALNSDRPYRKAWPRCDVIQYLRKQSGLEFDPAVVDAFLEVIGEA
jgi:PAS domain S-box-containing protein